MLRGIRAISDYEHEFQMALMNRRLAPEIETVFLQPAGRYSFVSSRMVKEVFSFGGDVTGLVPPNVLKRLRTDRRQRRLTVLASKLLADGSCAVLGAALPQPEICKDRSSYDSLPLLQKSLPTASAALKFPPPWL